MAFNAGSSTVSGTGIDGAEAADQLVQDALDDGGLDDADFGILFCSVDLDLEPFIAQMQERMDALDADWVGCTTAGELSDIDGADSGSAVLMLVDSDDISFTVSVVDGIHDDPAGVGKLAASQVVNTWPDGEDLDRVLFPLLAGQTFTTEEAGFEMLKGIVRNAPDIPIVGGAAADDFRMHQTHQFYNGEMYEDALVLTGITTGHQIVTGMENGLHEKIASGVVTSSDGCVIEEINGEPAAEFYADAIGASLRWMKLPGFFREAFHPDETLRYLYLRLTGQTELNLQHIVNHAVDHSMALEMGPGNYRINVPMTVTGDGGLIMKTPVQENQAIHVVEGDEDAVVSAAQDVFSDLDDDSESLFGVVVDCSWRRLAFEPEGLQEEVGQLNGQLDCPFIGFYSYGEIGGNPDTFCTYHNQTVSGFLIARDAGDGQDD